MFSFQKKINKKMLRKYTTAGQLQLLFKSRFLDNKKLANLVLAMLT